ncbi:hypothetical protein [Fodinicola feengrottensis]|uniref:hypothetical protein n=1 Tax=Fodinicola feengrottensis TaxID=435914 RepID=UPI0024425BCD|nr:hypothetical protein [Fodinicola feengrottensis]
MPSKPEKYFFGGAVTPSPWTCPSRLFRYSTPILATASLDDQGRSTPAKDSSISRS